MRDGYRLDTGSVNLLFVVQGDPPDKAVNRLFSEEREDLVE